MNQMTYDEAIGFIHGAYGQGEKRGQENMRALLALLSNPHEAFPAVHVAGTNGKGSVCAFVQAALRCAGYRTGLYTSPYLQRFNERMRVDGIPIADSLLAALTTRVAAAVETLRAQDIRPTEFEIGTALAFLFFAEQKVDIAVVEVGLGGRLDPTNILTPLVCAIAAIGFDHTKVLGSTLPDIALHKAGIAKPGVPLVLSGQNPPEVQAVVVRHCQAVGAPVQVSQPAPARYQLGLEGNHQAQNAGVALAVLALLGGRGFAVPESAMADGLRRVRWPGRLEWLDRHPPVLLDGAHNGHGAKALADYVTALPHRHTVLLCGILQGKDIGPMAEAFARFADAVVAVAPDSHRAVDAAILADIFVQHGLPARTAAALPEALEMAEVLAGNEGRVVVAGSLYLVGEARALLLGTQNTLLTPAEPEGSY